MKFAFAIYMEKFFTFGDHTIYYSIFGTGNEPMLAFHGFNREKDDFKIFEKTLGKKYKIYSFDLFHHGKTGEPNLGYTFDVKELEQFAHFFCSIEKIDRFSLLGYSLGGKIALVLLTLKPEKIKDVFLLAPYGVKQSEFILFAEKFEFCENIFRSFILQPEPFRKTVKFLNRLKLIKNRTYDFLLHQMESQARRQKLHDVWKTYYYIRPNLRLIQDLINRLNINCHVYYGLFDPVEPVSIGKLFASRIKNKNFLRIVPFNHNLVCEKMNEILSKDVTA